MNKKILWVALFLTGAASAESDCSWVIRLSQRTTTVVQDQSAFAAQASAFCQEYAQSKAENKSTSAGASYAGIGASFGQSGGSAESLASKLCKSDSQSSSRTDAYQQYVETIAPGAYASYNRCVELRASGVGINIESNYVLPTYLSAAVSYRSPESNSEGLFDYTSSPDVACKWKGGSKNQRGPIKLRGGEQTALECKRASGSVASTIKIFPTTRPDSALDFKWTNFRGDLPVDELLRLRASIDASVSALDATRESLAASVLGFAAEQCPRGWMPYQPAEGRFLRGIAPQVTATGDPDGKRKPGSYQADTFLDHVHATPDVIRDAGRMDQSNTPAAAANTYAFKSVGGTTGNAVGGGGETRPRNAAVLFCTPTASFSQSK